MGFLVREINSNRSLYRLSRKRQLDETISIQPKTHIVRFCIETYDDVAVTLTK